MNQKKISFWYQYKKTIILAYVILPMTIILPLVFMLAGLSVVASYVGFVPFLFSMYLFLKYRNTYCPHCSRHPQNLRNLLFPIDPYCHSCEKRMDQN